jgi:CRISPR-associated exonuclease Cas4
MIKGSVNWGERLITEGRPKIDLTVTDIKQFVYCPRVVYLANVLGVEKRVTRKMEYGKEMHIELDRLEKRRKLKRYGLDKGERRFHTFLYSVRLGLSGKLDLHIETDGEYFPVEFKNSPRGAFLNHKYQLTAYAMLLEDNYSRPIRTGFVYSIPLNQLFPIEITPNMREFVKDTMRKIRLMTFEQVLPKPTPHKKRCVDCEFINYCADIQL